MERRWTLSKKALAVFSVAAALGALALPGAALAQDSAPEFLSQQNGNVMWTLIAAILVMFMQAGFAMVETGLTRAKNAGNILMKNMFDFAAGSPAFFLIGFALMFGDDVGGFVGFSNFGLSEASTADADGLWKYTYWFFQCVFAATAVTIVSGAIAERTKFVAYLILSAAVTALVYPVSGHWIWGGGWLSKLDAPMIDFAGSTVVHSVGGWISLAGAMLLGPRIGKYTKDGVARAIPGHNLPLVALGVFILWFGWFGFNPGSTTVANGTIGLIAVTTNLAACMAGLSAMVTAWLRYGKPDVSMSLNGVLAGLVAITAGCANVSPGAALIIGLLAGILVVLSVEFIDKVLKIDDPVGAISVHGVCGAFGTLCVGLFASPDFGGVAGLFYGGGLTQLITQIIGVGSVFVWAFGSGLVLFGLLKITVGIRVTAEEELKGLDLTEHGSEAYSGFQIFITE
ncbi:ammonium transporter [Desulfolutivibrio sulfoxidireducens]|uniref:ammonium transporter n=1 Tax=Desulfolutivibrio sulfoxidireducens TaxID=2773299 RepID=UPI00159DF61E|nr:ammonium transporter [Desulfolutivibrio sulfoxidireducens]QLA21221.1 ammonium transporter [Desulfolutivibrio sulfoxidireducens]